MDSDNQGMTPGATFDPVASYEAGVRGVVVELGLRVKRQREMVGMPQSFLSAVLTMSGMPMTEADVERLEAGEVDEAMMPGIRLLAGLVMALEPSLDETFVAGFQRGFTGQGPDDNPRADVIDADTV